jgi:putative cell wall-binding protein
VPRIRRSRQSLPIAILLAAAVLATLSAAMPAVALAAPPVTILTLDPAGPDGSGGWWRNAPAAYATVNQTATLYYTFDTTQTMLAVTPGVLTFLDFAPQGAVTLKARAVNEAEETGTLVAVPTHVDSDAPSRPGNLTATPVGSAITLRWSKSTDTVSGTSGYRLYRNVTGPPFDPSQLVTFVSAPTTSFADHPSSSGTLYYGVSSIDRAGNESALSDAVTTSLDTSPPTAPSDLQAWLNGVGFARVSWRASTDLGSGVALYVVRRTVDGEPESTVATVGAAATEFDDYDPKVPIANVVKYSVYAVDRNGLVSPTTGPVTMGTDITPPSMPDAPQVVPYVTGAAMQTGVFGTDVIAKVPLATDAGSGLWRGEILYGPNLAAPAYSAAYAYVWAASIPIATSPESISWYFRVRAEDRAGNGSALSPYTFVHVASANRIAGADRVATAVGVSGATFAHAGTVVVAGSRAYPDALAAASLAGAIRGPVLLVGPGVLRQDVHDELHRLGATNAYVIGGPTVVSATTLDSLHGVLSGAVVRVAGADRYFTAAAVEATVRALRGGVSPKRVFLVSGLDFPDALSVGPAAYVSKCPILFAKPSGVPNSTRNAIAASGATRTVIVGGTPSVWSGAEGVVPGPRRVAGANRYLTSMAFADWSITAGLLTAARPVVVTGLNYPDGLAAAPMAGERTSPILLVGESVDPASGWFASRALGIRRLTAVGAVTIEQESLLWSVVAGQ